MPMWLPTFAIRRGPSGGMASGPAGKSGVAVRAAIEAVISCAASMMTGCRRSEERSFYATISCKCAGSPGESAE